MNLEELKKEILNKKMSLLEMDNKIQDILKTNTSLFDFENDCINQLSCAYYVNNQEIIVEFEILKKEKNNFDTIVKITNIWRF